MSPAVYRSLTQAALDREYDNQKKIGQDEFRAFLARCAHASEAARRRHRARLDVAYGPSAAETLDIFFAEGAAGAAPVQIFFHGGYWRMLDKKDFSYVANGLVPQGITSVIVNYALLPQVDMAELLRQCRAAVAWTARHIAELGGDPSRLHVSGHSAGGHIAAMMLAAEGAERIRSATAISGLYDLEPIRLCFLNATLGLTARDVARHSPVHLSRRGSAPLLLAVGGSEGEEYLDQSRALERAWRHTAIEILPDDDHFSIREQLGDPSSAMVSLMRRTMGLA
jgi:arylformamidase